MSDDPKHIDFNFVRFGIALTLRSFKTELQEAP